MNDEPPTSPPRRGWSCLEWVVAIFCILLLIGLFMPARRGLGDLANQTATSNNCRQIIMAMKIWANEHNGQFPDATLPEAKSANEVFRNLVVDDIISEERIFGAKQSRYQPDGNIGTAPAFAEAITPGENHWMMMTGLNEKSPGIIPFVFENAFSAQWPLTWSGSMFNEPLRGRAWKNGKIIVGRVDNSVNVETLVPENGQLVLPPSFREDVEKAAKSPLRVLDIEEKK